MISRNEIEICLFLFVELIGRGKPPGGLYLILILKLILYCHDVPFPLKITFPFKSTHSSYGLQSNFNQTVCFTYDARNL